jgi:RNA polymerase sigma-70 factor (ECF subfamily)
LKDFNTLRALFYKIARNVVIDHYRSQTQSANTIYEEDLKVEIPDDKQNIAEQIDIKANLAQIETAMFELKDDYREALVMRYVNELSVKEMSQILGKTPGNIRVLVYRAMEALKKINQEK